MFETQKNKKEPNMESVITVRCLCGRQVVVNIIGGQYQDVYKGDCECGRKWALEEQSEVMKEISEE